MMTEYNPNYEFAGGTCTIQDLREVDRDNLILVKYVIIVTELNSFYICVGLLARGHSVRFTKGC